MARAKGNVVIVSSEEEWESTFDEFQRNLSYTNVVGFDCEWVEFSNWKRLYEREEMNELNCLRASSSKSEMEMHELRLQNTTRDKVSLLQMSTYTGFTILVRLILFKKLPASLKTFLEDTRIVKVGVNIFADCSRLYKDWGALVNSWLDIRFLLNDLPCSKMTEPIRNGLKAIGEKFCMDAKKHSDKMRYSNWCSTWLEEGQIDYASQDSKMAIESFIQLVQELFQLSRHRAKMNFDYNRVDCVEFWREAYRMSSVHLNRKFDQEHYMSVKTGGTGAGKRKKTRDEIEDSSSDLDLDTTCLNDNFKCDSPNMIEFYDIKSDREQAKPLMVMSKNFLPKKSSGPSDDDRNIVKIAGRLYRLTRLE